MGIKGRLGNRGGEGDFFCFFEGVVDVSIVGPSQQVAARRLASLVESARWVGGGRGWVDVVGWTLSKHALQFTPPTDCKSSHPHTAIHTTHALQFTPPTHCNSHHPHTAIHTTHALQFTPPTNCKSPHPCTAIHTTHKLQVTPPMHCKSPHPHGKSPHPHTAIHTTHKLQVTPPTHLCN